MNRLDFVSLHDVVGTETPSGSAGNGTDPEYCVHHTLCKPDDSLVLAQLQKIIGPGCTFNLVLCCATIVVQFRFCALPPARCQRGHVQPFMSTTVTTKHTR